MNKNYLSTGFILSTAFLLSSCSNTSPLNKNSINSAQVSPVKVFSNPIKQATTIKVDWQNVEAIANKSYQNISISQSTLSKQDMPPKVSFIEKAYAKSFGVSTSEASRRLTIQTVGNTLIEAIQQDLGDAFIEGYYINEDPDEFKVGITTLDTVLAERYVYQFKDTSLHLGSESLTVPVYIYPISDKTKAQILTLMDKMMSEIIKRYPDTQGVGYSPVTNSITVDIYNKTPDEEERKRIENELTKLVGHPVIVQFSENRMTML